MDRKVRATTANGDRFDFGGNWSRFLPLVTEQRIAAAQGSLKEMLELDTLVGRRFLDIGCGSGLFSLAARRLGAEVVSFDCDSASVACALALKHRHCSDDAWRIEQGSVLDADFVRSLGPFDIVYAWGVLHHTGAMWQGLANAAIPVADQGRLFLAIYNDQGRMSRLWTWVKKTYNRLPRGLRFLVVVPALGRLWGPTILGSVLSGRGMAPWRDYRSVRGMSAWHDTVDWIGGYPFEVARPERILEFYRDRGFQLRKLKTCAGGHGCNEYVFLKARLAGS